MLVELAPAIVCVPCPPPPPPPSSLSLTHPHVHASHRNNAAGFGVLTNATIIDAIKECLKFDSICSKRAYGPIWSWDVSSVADMSYLFVGYKSDSRYVPGAETFNGDISKWNVAKVTNMQFMFYGAPSFNGDLSNWDVGEVTDMQSMFNGAISYNSDMSKWDVGKVTNMWKMFYGATAFKQVLCGAWQFSKAGKAQMFFGSPGKIGDLTTCRAFPPSLSPHTCLPNDSEHLSGCIRRSGCNGCMGVLGTSAPLLPCPRTHTHTHTHTHARAP